MKLSKNPPEMFHNFRKLVAVGGEDQSEEEKEDELNKLENISQN